MTNQEFLYTTSEKQILFKQTQVKPAATFISFILGLGVNIAVKICREPNMKGIFTNSLVIDNTLPLFHKPYF